MRVFALTISLALLAAATSPGADPSDLTPPPTDPATDQPDPGKVATNTPASPVEDPTPTPAADVKSAAPVEPNAASPEASAPTGGPTPADAAHPPAAPSTDNTATPSGSTPAEENPELNMADSMAWRELQDIVLREQAVWKRLRAEVNDESEQRRAQAEFRNILTAYENLLTTAPKFAEAYAAYGLLLNRTGNRDEAARAFLKANEINRALPMVKNQLGNYLFEEGRYPEALGYYMAAIELKEDEPLYHYQLGSLLREYRRFFVDDGLFDGPTIDAKMQAAFHRAAELAPNRWGFIYRYAESFYDLETPNWPAALEAWEKLEEKANPGIEQQTVRLHQANVLARMKRRDEAQAIVDSITEPTLAQSRAEVIALIGAIDPAEALAPPPEPDEEEIFVEMPAEEDGRPGEPRASKTEPPKKQR